jgi:hypothetical protein
MNRAFETVGRALARFLTAPRRVPSASPPTPAALLQASLTPGDILLVEGDSRVSAAIKYLTQSTWSHAALYVGAHGHGRLADPSHCFIEVDLAEGVRSVGIDEYERYPTRICRPVGLTQEERRAVTDFAIARLGYRYDLRNFIDLARYLMPTPPVPTRFRRRMMAFGGGDPTRAICSTLISQAFYAIGYPILPTREYQSPTPEGGPDYAEEARRIRHYSLYAPRDFDVSPYFQIVKPTIEGGFDFRTVKWDRGPPGGAPIA